MNFLKINVCDINFDNLTMDEAVSRGMELMDQKKAAYVVTPNSEIAWMCRKDGELKKLINGADMVLPDGIGIIYGAKILGRPMKEKVAGCDFAENIFAAMAKTDKTAYLLGAKPGVAEKAAENLMAKYPGLKIVGTADGYFKEDGPVVEKINAVEPELLLVCLGAPKQEKWMVKNAPDLKVGLMAGLGGSLDVFSGTVERAPEKWQKMGLEWLYRLYKEPKRIKRMSMLPAFLISTVWQRLRGK